MTTTTVPARPPTRHRRLGMLARAALGLAAICSVGVAAQPAAAATAPEYTLLTHISSSGGDHTGDVIVDFGSGGDTLAYTGSFSGPLAVTDHGDGTRTYRAVTTGQVSRGSDTMTAIEHLAFTRSANGATISVTVSITIVDDGVVYAELTGAGTGLTSGLGTSAKVKLVMNIYYPRYR